MSDELFHTWWDEAKRHALKPSAAHYWSRLGWRGCHNVTADRIAELEAENERLRDLVKRLSVDGNPLALKERREEGWELADEVCQGVILEILDMGDA
uniref:Uncharacterized protein n=1 Tax=viral metagenome TaxID=1070528 RepID=A0A6M3LY86_9ZZZZ